MLYNHRYTDFCYEDTSGGQGLISGVRARVLGQALAQLLQPRAQNRVDRFDRVEQVDALVFHNGTASA
jgi:hypothetical protein